MSNRLGLLVSPEEAHRDSCRPDPVADRSKVIYDRANDQTVVTRWWTLGDSRRCRLCPRGTCIAEEDRGMDYCQLLIPGRVKREDAAGVSTVGIPRVRSPQ